MEQNAPLSSHMFPKGDAVSLWQLDVSHGSTVQRYGALTPKQLLFQNTSASDMICMAVGVDWKAVKRGHVTHTQEEQKA